MAKRMQEQKGEEHWIASKSLETLTATGKLESRMRRNSKSDAASSSQVKLQDAYLGGLMDIATEKLVAGSFRI